MSKPRIAIVGATGYVGRRLSMQLVQSGVPVRNIARTASQDAELSRHPLASSHDANVLKPDTLDGVFDEIETIYYLVHSMGGGNNKFEQDDIAAALNVADAARSAGVSRIIYLSGLGNPDSDLSAHLRSRHHTGEALRRTGIPVTELRAAIILGSGSASYEILRDLAKRLPLMITPRWVSTKCEPIAIRDVLFYLEQVLDEPRSLDQVLEIGCGEVYEYRDLIRIVAEIYDRPRPLILPVKVMTPRLSSYWLHLVTSVDISLARPLIEGLRNDVVTTDERIREWIPHTPLTVAEAVNLAKQREENNTSQSHWSTSSAVHREETTTSRDALVGGQSLDEFVDEREFNTDLSPEQLFDQVTQLGGDAGYGRWQLLWRIRGAMDRIIGGVGLRRGRPRRPLRGGDAVDFWRVEQFDPPKLMSLRAEMKLPGRAYLTFTVEPTPHGSRLIQRASLVNEGIWSRLYWMAVAPLHEFVFDAVGQHIIAGPRRSRRS